MAGQAVITLTFHSLSVSHRYYYTYGYKTPIEISSLLVDYEGKGLSIRQIAAKKLHSRSTIRKCMKRADVHLRAPGQGHGNPSQLRFGYRKEAGKVEPHLGEQQVISAIKDLKTEGMTLRQIAHRMTVLGIPSKNGKLRWHPMMVKRILNGDMKPSGVL